MLDTGLSFWSTFFSWAPSLIWLSSADFSPPLASVEGIGGATGGGPGGGGGGGGGGPPLLAGVENEGGGGGGGGGAAGTEA